MQRQTKTFLKSNFIKCHILRGVFLLISLAIIGSGAATQTNATKSEVFPPESGKGAVVIIASGASGTTAFRSFASKLSKIGYYVVLIDGTSIYKRYASPSFDGAALLQSTITEAKASALALPGKVGLVGFSIGGAAVLVHGGQMKDLVAAAVAYYPAITPLGPHFNALATGIQVPVLLIAGEQDRYIDCCLIESMRSLASSPKTVSFELVTYPAADHGFNLEDTQFTYRENDAQDAWSKTVIFLQALLPPRGQN